MYVHVQMYIEKSSNLDDWVGLPRSPNNTHADSLQRTSLESLSLSIIIYISRCGVGECAGTVASKAAAVPAIQCQGRGGTEK